jgi:DNA-binding CsgD family transcriptional regulator
MAHVKAAGSRAVVIAENGEAAHSFIAHDIRGVVYRNTAGPELVACVQGVIKGSRSIQRPGEATGSGEEDSIGMRVRDRLTPKEMQVVAVLMQGCKNKGIALRLGTTEQVIKNCLRSIYDKTGVFRSPRTCTLYHAQSHTDRRCGRGGHPRLGTGLRATLAAIQGGKSSTVFLGNRLCHPTSDCATQTSGRSIIYGKKTPYRPDAIMPMANREQPSDH